MTLPQWFSIATLAGMMVLFLWGKFRYDITAVIALLVALCLGIVKPGDAFSGFSDDIVIIVGSALVLSAAVYVWRDDILRTRLDPKEPFQTYDPPPAPDYAQRSAWALMPNAPEAPTASRNGP